MWTQKCVIINLKVVVIQQLGNYFDYHRHLMNWLHTDYSKCESVSSQLNVGVSSA